MKSLLPFLLLVLVHHFFLAPLIRKRLPLYLALTLGLLILFGVWCLAPGDRPGPPPPPQWQSEELPPPPGPDWMAPEPPEGRRPLRPEALKLIIGVLLVGADLGVFFYLESRRKERRMKELQAENLQLQRDIQAARSAGETDPVLHFKADRRTVNVDVDKIVYVESMSEYIKIYLSDAESPVVVLYSLKQLIAQLHPDRFMRIHRSYIISLRHITEASRTGVRLDNGVSLPVGEISRPAFAEYLASC